MIFIYIFFGFYDKEFDLKDRLQRKDKILSIFDHLYFEYGISYFQVLIGVSLLMYNSRIELAKL